VSDAPALELLDLRKDYGQTTALAGVSLSVGAGEIFGYIGPNGAGKTTTIKLLAGLLQPTSGRASLCGHDVAEAPLEAKACLGYVPESGAVFDKLSPREYLTFAGRLHGLSEATIAARSDEWLRYFELLDRADQQMVAFSKGMRQRVCWAQALLHEPQVLVLDEPLNGLDAGTVAKVKDLMRSLAASGRTIFYSSHLIDVVERVCSRIGVLHCGRLAATGSVAEVIALAGTATLEEALLSLTRNGG
jgi:ABC-2 type transport system ATP-binding protein